MTGRGSGRVSHLFEVKISTVFEEDDEGIWPPVTKSFVIDDVVRLLNEETEASLLTDNISGDLVQSF